MNKKTLLPPRATVKRLSVYLRYLTHIEAEGANVISSRDLAEKLALNPAQVRKDLAYFGDFGKRGVGYSIKSLRESIIKILGLEKVRRVGIVGAAGHLGRALACYTGFQKRNFQVVALFDNKPELIGQDCTACVNAGKILADTDIPKIVKEREIDILILTVPVSAVEDVYKLVVASKVKTVLNFAPYKLISTDDIMVNNVDLTIELESLSYELNRKDYPSKTKESSLL